MPRSSSSLGTMMNASRNHCLSASASVSPKNRSPGRHTTPSANAFCITWSPSTSDDSSIQMKKPPSGTSNVTHGPHWSRSACTAMSRFSRYSSLTMATCGSSFPSSMKRVTTRASHWLTPRSPLTAPRARITSGSPLTQPRRSAGARILLKLSILTTSPDSSRENSVGMVSPS